MSKAAVIFPGIGYNFDRPLLHFGIEWAGENGYEIIRVPYTGFPPKIRGSRERMGESLELAEQQTQILLKDVKWDQYERILFISKSIGTIAAADYASGRPTFRNDSFEDISSAIPVSSGQSFNKVHANVHGEAQVLLDANGNVPLQILFTPFPETFERLPKESVSSNTIAFHGTGDPWMDNDAVMAAAKGRGIPMYLYEGANHSLETGNTRKDLETLSEVFVELEAWKKQML